jgi:hypothetical protein
MTLFTQDSLSEALGLLAEEMALRSIAPHDLVVCGGSALLALKISRRTTKDVDILAFLNEERSLIEPRPLSPDLLEAAARVGRLLNLPEHWLNAGPADQLRAGLPEGCASRLQTVEFGPKLRVHYTSRYDLIHLKLFALIDQGPGKHLLDLQALDPTKDELLAAARWVATQDAGEVFPGLLRSVLKQLGHDDIARKI